MLYAATAESAAVPTTMSTILEVNPPASRKAIITEASITFKGISATDPPVLVQFVEVTAASAAGTAVTPAPLKDYGASTGFASATAAKKLPATEGTVTVLKTYMVPPSSGLVIQYPLGREPEIVGAATANKGFAIRANRGTGAAVDCDCNIEFDE